MAPASRTPRRAAREQDYQAIGRKGRRTGATLKDTGIRDEHGLEPVPSFSSPEKSAPTANGVNGVNGDHGTYTEDVTMETGDSTIPEVTDRLRPGRLSSTKFPLAPGRSPMKTHTGSSPRRSVGPMSPSKRYDAETPTRSFSHPPPSSLAKRKINEASEEQNIQGGRGSTLKRPKKTPPGRPKKHSLNMDIEKEPEADETMAMTNGEVTTNGDITHADATTNGYIDEDTPIQGIEDDSMEVSADNGVVEETTAGGQAEEEPSQIPETQETQAAPPQKRGRGRPSRQSLAESSQLSLSTAKPVGRQPRIHRDSSAAPSATKKGAPGRSKKGALQPTSADRGPNAIIKPRARANSKAPRSRRSSVRASSRNNFIARSMTPAEGPGALITRSGRHSFKPLASWRGEKAVFAPTSIEPDGTHMGGIEEIIRTEEIIEPRPKYKSYKRKGRAPSKKLEDVDEEDEDMEDWEREPGIMVGNVMAWDAVEGHYVEDQIDEQEIAYASNAIEMRDIANAEFRFAKTLTLPFFGSGMVDLPPGGAKRSKNSRKMQMVFFVFYGRVTVEVGTPTTRFGIGKGGMWQVPRGNFYSITNHSPRPARIFFAQGCEVIPEPGLEEGVSA